VDLVVIQRGDTLVVRIADDGVGGAAVGLGTGLTGLNQRVSTVDGRLDVVSPAGGPTTVTVGLPVRAGGGRLRVRVVIAEESGMMREGLVRLLTDRGHEIAAAVGDAEALRLAVDAREPDVAVIDIRMPPTHTDEGLRAALDLRRVHPSVGVLVFSQYVETRY